MLMNGINAARGTLAWDVLALKRRGFTRDVPRAKPEDLWVANSSTLIWGRRDAVVVDTFLTKEHAQVQADWIAASGRNLVTIYITHGHGDHFFGLAPLLSRFPRARAVAMPQVVEAMRAQLTPQSIDGFWLKLFPGEIADRLLVAEPLEDGRLELEGHSLLVVETGRTDTACSTSLHVPSAELLVAGDVVYNGIHPYLGETDTQSRLEWIAALDELEALQAKVVVAGHKVPDNRDDPQDIERTRQYLSDFNRVDAATSTAMELFEAMLDLYPDRANPGSLWSGAQKAKQTSSFQ
jgi:glyoxylase-like metal-dependent hydrolase (beta-lactamase superfamily II)